MTEQYIGFNISMFNQKKALVSNSNFSTKLY